MRFLVGLLLVGFLFSPGLFPGAFAAEDSGEEESGSFVIATYDEGFRFSTRDGAFALRLNGLLQGRYTYVDFDPAVRYNQESYSNFFMRRARLYFSGHAGSPRLTYLFHIQLEPSQGINANDMWFEWKFSNLLRLGGGRNKIAYGLEMLNSGSALGMVERSVMSGETDIDLGSVLEPGPAYPGGGTNRFGLSTVAGNGFATGGMNLYRSLGIQLRGMTGSGDNSSFEYQLGIWQGRATSSLSNQGDGHLVSLRVGWHPWGFVDWKIVGDIDHTDSFKLGVIGSAYANRGGRSEAFDESGWNVAALARWRGWSMDLEWGVERFDFAAFSRDYEREGFRASIGWYVVPGVWEVRGRYAEIQRLKQPTYRAAMDSGLGVAEVADGDEWIPALEAEISEISVAVSRRIPGARNKILVDASRLVRSFAADPDAIIDGVAVPIARADDQLDYRVRLMVQLVF